MHWSTVNAKRPLCLPEGHFVGLLFAGHSSKSGVLGNGHGNGGHYVSLF